MILIQRNGERLTVSLRSHFVGVWEMCWSLPDAEKLNVVDRQIARGGSFKK